MAVAPSLCGSSARLRALARLCPDSIRARASDHYQPQYRWLARAQAVMTVMVDHFAADVPNFPCRIGSISGRPE
jgi:hypothetical protein